MMKFFTHRFNPKLLLLLFILLPLFTKAQTEQDALMMPGRNICVAGLVGYSSWTDYWEGTFKRNNANMGRVSTQVNMLMLNYGIKNNLNVLATVPYLKTKATQGTLAGMSGFQDISLWLKWKPVQKQFGKLQVSLFTLGGYSLPSHNYNIDFLPMSIGLGSKVLTGKLLADFQVSKFTVSVSGAYLHRSNVTIDRPAYYTDRQVNSSEVVMPDAGNFQLRAGYRGKQLFAEAFADNMTTFGGFDIRKNDMPFVSNEMNSTRVGVEAKYYLNSVRGLGFHANAWRVVQGRNVGKATGYMGGVSYILDFIGSEKL